MTHYSPARQRRARFFVASMVFGVVLLSIAAVIWPTKTRQARRLLTSVAESMSCEGPITQGQAVELRRVLQARFADLTAVQIMGPEALDGTFSRDQLFENFVHCCAATTRFRLGLTQISVDATDGGGRAQARADLDIEYQLEGRTQYEHRPGLFSLRWTPSGFRLTSMQVLPRVVNQPEPRP